MFEESRILAVIPARGGSKGVPRKNIRDLDGKPLIAWTIKTAQESNYLDRIILSSDDEEIISVAQSYDCEVPFVRPKELAQDDTPAIDVVLHAIAQCPGFTHIMLLQPTSPFRTHEHIDEMIEDLFRTESKCSVSVVSPDKHPYWMFEVSEDKNIIPLFSGNIVSTRQCLPQVYAVNGALYLSDINYLKEKNSFFSEETKCFIMPRENSLDIDTEFDFELAEFLIDKKSV